VTNANAEFVVQFLRTCAEQAFPSQVLDFDMSGDFYGFGISHHGGLTLLYADTTNEPAQWWVQVSSALVVDIPDVTGIIQWVNAKNRSSVIGKYYCAISRSHDMAAAICETLHYGDLLFSLLTSRPTLQPVTNWLVMSLRSQVENCAADGGELLQRFGGRQFGGNELDLTGLFVMSNAG
jgi:hypothetical protein